jgi:hypothetical protein
MFLGGMSSLNSSVGIIGVPDEIRNKYILNVSPKYFRYIKHGRIHWLCIREGEYININVSGHILPSSSGKTMKLNEEKYTGETCV